VGQPARAGRDGGPEPGRVTGPASGVGDPDFRALWAGAGFSQFAARMAAVAIPLIAVAHLHASAFQAGVLTALSTLAFLIIGLPAGVIVDRARQRFVLWGALPLGGLAGGVLGATVGVPAALWVGAAGIVVSCLPLLVSQLRRPVPEALAGLAS
jgi:MFS family permease